MNATKPVLDLIDEELSQRIRERILERGFSASGVSRHLGWGESTLISYLNIHSGISPKRFDELMLFLDLCE